MVRMHPTEKVGPIFDVPDWGLLMAKESLVVSPLAEYGPSFWKAL